MLVLRFDNNEIQYWAARYDYPGDAEVEADAAENKKCGYLTKKEFLALCKWKTACSQPLCADNSDNVIREATRIALSAKNEELRIGVLQILNGVSWPTAPVILHFGKRIPTLYLMFGHSGVLEQMNHQHIPLISGGNI